VPRKGGPLDIAVEVGSISIVMRHHAWITWAEIAIGHESLAKEARQGVDVYEFGPGLVALTCAAFALDALYDVAKPLIPNPRSAGKRAAIVAERLKRGVWPGRLAVTWPTRIGRIFDERDAAVHFGEETVSPVWHPVLSSNVDPFVLRFGAVR
jgi:hypothetical protein